MLLSLLKAGEMACVVCILPPVLPAFFEAIAEATLRTQLRCRDYVAAIASQKTLRKIGVEASPRAFKASTVNDGESFSHLFIFSEV
jgi:hypothetical protein